MNNKQQSSLPHDVPAPTIPIPAAPAAARTSKLLTSLQLQPRTAMEIIQAVEEDPAHSDEFEFDYIVDAATIDYLHMKGYWLTITHLPREEYGIICVLRVSKFCHWNRG